MSSDIPTFSDTTTFSPSPTPSQTADTNTPSTSEDARPTNDVGASSLTTPAPSSTSSSLSLTVTSMTDILGNLTGSSEIIDDMDLRVVYNGAWLQKVNDLGYAGTLHVTGQLYASLTVSFYGSGITVLGYVPLGIAPVTVRYTIDGDASTTQDRQVGGSAILVVDQPFYAASGLPLQQHNLTMNVTSGVPTRLFGYDCFVVDKSVGGRPTTSSSPTSSTNAHAGSKHSMSGGQIAATVVGSVVGTLLITIFAFLCCCKKKRSTPVPDTAPRPLPLFDEKNHLDLAGHQDFLIAKTTSPGPVTESTILLECFGIEIRRAVRM